MIEKEETKEPTTGDDSADGPGWREPAAVFVGVVLFLAALSGLAMVWAPMSSHILAIAAFVFLGVPFVLLSRRDADFHRFGIDLEKIPLRHIGLGLLTCAVVFPLYAAGNHVFETQVQERDFQPSFDHYRQWPVELDAPRLSDGFDESIQIRTATNQLYIEWSTTDADPELIVDGDRPFGWSTYGPVSAKPIDDDKTDGAQADQWRITTTNGDGRLTLRPPGQPDDSPLPARLKLDLVSPSDAEPAGLWVGADTHSSDEPIELKRTYWWLLLFALTHLILVALPEEYFYRGYLQTRLAELFGDSPDAEGSRKTFLGFSRANWATSALFALGHILIPIGGAFSLARGAVFFPSLVFGWLREKTGSIIAPTIFHAGANMMVLVLAVHYF